jgi:hypothetical protein
MGLALLRLKSVRELGIQSPAATHVRATRVAAAARLSGAAQATAFRLLPVVRRLATLVAFVHCVKHRHRTTLWSCSKSPSRSV